MGGWESTTGAARGDWLKIMILNDVKRCGRWGRV